MYRIHLYIYIWLVPKTGIAKLGPQGEPIALISALSPHGVFERAPPTQTKPSKADMVWPTKEQHMSISYMTSMSIRWLDAEPLHALLEIYIYTYLNIEMCRLSKWGGWHTGDQKMNFGLSA